MIKQCNISIWAIPSLPLLSNTFSLTKFLWHLYTKEIQRTKTEVALQFICVMLLVHRTGEIL